MASRTRPTAVDLDLEELRERSDDRGLLERVAVTLGSTLDLGEVLHRLATIVLEMSSAQRCSIVLLSGRRLEPAVAISTRPDEDLWAAYRAMPPIELDALQWGLILGGRAVAIEDARCSEVMPREWVERFGLRAMAVVPLLADGEPCGVMALDWPEPRPADSLELALLEAIGTYAGIAVHNARLHEGVAARSRTLEHLVGVSAWLNSSSSLATVLDRVCSGFEQLLGTTHCSVNLIDPERPLHLRTLATRGEPWFSRRSGDGEAIPPEELTGVDRLWAASGGPIVYPVLDPEASQPPLVIPRSVRSAVLFPLFAPDGLVGSVVAGFPRSGSPSPEALDTGQTLAELAAAAIERARLHDQLGRRLRQVEILYRLSDVVSGTSDLPTALSDLNEGMGTELGFRLESVVIAGPGLRAAVGGEEPGVEEQRAFRAWRAVLASEGSPVRIQQVAESVLVPLVHHGRVQGALRATVHGDALDASDDEFLLAVGWACAEIIHRAALSRALAESERRLAIAAERERLAQDLHDSAGQVLTGMGMLLGEYVAQAPDEVWRQRLAKLRGLARQGDDEIRDAIASLLFLRVRQEGLVRSVEHLAENFQATTGIAVAVTVRGAPVALAPEQEDALFRVAHEALANVERHAHATTLSVSMRYEPEGVAVVVEDDGVGVDAGVLDGRAGRFGLRGVDQRMRGIGGSLRLRSADPRGTRVEARLPLRLHVAMPR